MMTDALKRMRDKLIDLEYDDPTETDSVEIDEDVEDALALLNELSSEKDSSVENSKRKTEL